MHEPLQKRPLLKAGWLRALIFTIVYACLMLLGTNFLPQLAKMAAISVDIKGDSWDGSFLGLGIVLNLLLSIGLVALCRRLLDRSTFKSLGLAMRSLASPLHGFALATSLLGAGTMILYFSKHLRWVDITPNGNDLFIELGIMIMIGFYEEIVFRGYVLQNLLKSWNKWLALAVSSLVFASFHLNNPGMTLIPFINLFLAGVILGISYVYTKNLWFAIAFHFAWNFFQGPILGYKVSGLTLSALLQTEMKGDDLLTGGSFGFEGSVIDIGLSLLAIWWLYSTLQKKYATVPDVSVES